MHKLITASLWITTHGAFPRKMETLTGSMEQTVEAMRRLAPQIPLMTARDMIRRGAFEVDTVWSPDRGIGIKVESVATDRLTTQDLSELATRFDMSEFLRHATEHGPVLMDELAVGGCQ